MYAHLERCSRCSQSRFLPRNFPPVSTPFPVLTASRFVSRDFSQPRYLSLPYWQVGNGPDFVRIVCASPSFQSTISRQRWENARFASWRSECRCSIDKSRSWRIEYETWKKTKISPQSTTIDRRLIERCPEPIDNNSSSLAAAKRFFIFPWLVTQRSL